MRGGRSHKPDAARTERRIPDTAFGVHRTRYSEVRTGSIARETCAFSTKTRPPASFFFQAEDGIRDVAVTGVQTCALPISDHPGAARRPDDRLRGAAHRQGERGADQ